MNNQHPGISKGIIQSISKLKEDQEFEDFKVKVDGNIYSCHSFILASCSEFFRRLLRSDMKEKNEMTVELINISSPIFQLILNSLYTGCELLTKENVLEVWSAVHQLQIQFLIKHCEDFVEVNLYLDTLEVYKQMAELVQSDRICEYIFSFICEKFEAFRKTEAMLELNFQELLSIIKSDKLKVSSEDEVLFSIFDWVSHGELLTSYPHHTEVADAAVSDTLHSSAHVNSLSNTLLETEKESSLDVTQITSSTIEKELTDSGFHKDDSNERKKYLVELINSTRYCLASESCIIKLYENKLIQTDTKVKDILFQALSFHSSGYCHGFWPTSAIQRDCSPLRHVGVYCDKSYVRAFCFNEKKWFLMSDLPLGSGSILTVYNRELYAFIYNESNRSKQKQIYKQVKDKWAFVTNVDIFCNAITSKEKYIYFLYRDEMMRFNPNETPLDIEKFCNDIENPEYALSFYNNIVVFSSVESNRVEETAVHSWNTETEVWTQLDNLEFSSKNMTSFRDDKDTYILDSNGNLWKLTNSEIIGFKFLAKLWELKCQIKGAVLKKKTLYVVFKYSNDLGLTHTVPGVFYSIRFCRVTSISSNFIHYVVPTNELTPAPRVNEKFTYF